MSLETAAGLSTASIATLTLMFGVVQYYLRKRDEWLISILDGTKESAALTSMRIRNRAAQPRWRRAWRERRWGKRRKEEVQVLCLAWVFERSGRARSLVLDALVTISRAPGGLAQMREFTDRMTIATVRAAGFTDLSSASRRLDNLRGALGLDGDRRSRVAIADTHGHEPWPCACGNLVHSTGELRSSLATLNQLVLICPSVSDSVIALDFHRPRSSQEKRPAGELVRTAKYGTSLPSLARDQAIDILARRLAVVVDGSTVLSSAAAIAGIPGSHMTDALASKIRSRLAESTERMEQVTLEPDGSGFKVPEPGPRLAGRVILVDDVYRTGETFAAGAAALRTAGFTEVVGLTATCSFTRVTPSCDQDEDADSST